MVGSGLAAHDTCTPAKAKEWTGCERESMGDNRAMVVKVCRGSGAHLDRLVESELLFLGDPIEEDLCRAAGASVSQGTATGSDPNQVCGKGQWSCVCAPWFIAVLMLRFGRLGERGWVHELVHVQQCVQTDKV